jgi:hypothetical protein
MPLSGYVRHARGSFYFEDRWVDPLTRLAEFTLSPFAALRAVRSGRANGLATLSPKGARARVRLLSYRAVKLVRIQDGFGDASLGCARRLPTNRLHSSGTRCPRGNPRFVEIVDQGVWHTFLFKNKASKLLKIQGSVSKSDKTIPIPNTFYSNRSCNHALPRNHENDPSPALVPRAPSPQGRGWRSLKAGKPGDGCRQIKPRAIETYGDKVRSSVNRFTSSLTVRTRSGECHLSAAGPRAGSWAYRSQLRTQVPLFDFS